MSAIFEIEGEANWGRRVFQFGPEQIAALREGRAVFAVGDLDALVGDVTGPDGSAGLPVQETRFDTAPPVAGRTAAR
jgi:hypothetical protein